MGITSCTGGASCAGISASPLLVSILPPGSSNRFYSLALPTAAAATHQQVARQCERHRKQGLRNVLIYKFSPRRRSFEKDRLGLQRGWRDSWHPWNLGVQVQLLREPPVRAAEISSLRQPRLFNSWVGACSASRLGTYSASKLLRLGFPGCCSKSRKLSVSASAIMGTGGIFDLEKQFAQYGAYHSNNINILIHVIFVWPILFTAFTLLAYTQPLAPQTPFMAVLPYHEYMVLNYSFVAAAVYALFYISLEQKSGSLAALLVLVCWIGANAVAQHVPYSLGWKIVAVSQVVCWSFQFIGHGVFEGRAPALLDNLAQAFLMAPYFVLLEVLHSLLNYEPYSGFTKSVQSKVGVQIAEFRSKKAKGKRID